MNPVHLHLMLNHIPLVGVGFVILLFVIAIFLRSNQLINISLIFVILVALWAIPAHQTGELAEEYVENLPSYSEQLVYDHDIAADIAFIFTEVVGVLALISLISRRFHKKFSHKITILTLLGLIVCGVLLARAANLGGKIHHPELRGNDNSVNVPLYKDGEEND
ncbi:MAG: hypothetical protein GTO02_03820 [Candidatus Dadabacteria bacterium]|nr:hypothetical protein [Candidatus Dadabacteria bacterium]NIQ13553.1 hypothetical protein [Candidatus Dadabacteria bacterium]